jgi:hypothetical protein
MSTYAFTSPDRRSTPAHCGMQLLPPGSLVASRDGPAQVDGGYDFRPGFVDKVIRTNRSLSSLLGRCCVAVARRAP